MAAYVRGLYSWGGGRDDNGHRTYEAVWSVEAQTGDGPAVIMNATGLPLPGSVWQVGNDVDLWAYCTPYLDIKAVLDGEPNDIFHVSQKFTTRPMTRCNDTSIDNPLDEPPSLRGGFIPYKEEALKDRFGNLLLSSSLERMRGPEVEVERGMPTIQISLNVGSLPLSTYSEYRGSVNSDVLWGLPARTIRLADISWERLLYGTCSYYYRMSYTFEVKYETWNRFILDQGSRVKILKTQPLSNTNPLIPYQNPFSGKYERTYLDGQANAVDSEYGDMSQIYIHEKEIEEQRDFSILGIPLTL